MKPHIFFDGLFKVWACDGFSVMKVGRTPSDAYKNWRAAFAVLCLKALENEE